MHAMMQKGAELWSKTKTEPQQAWHQLSGRICRIEAIGSGVCRRSLLGSLETAQPAGPLGMSPASPALPFLASVLLWRCAPSTAAHTACFRPLALSTLTRKHMSEVLPSFPKA